MIKVLGILVISILIAMREIPSLLKHKKKKEIWIFVLFLSFATSLLCLISLDVKLPSPLEAIRVVYKPISDALSKLLS
ncbi:hypothetical protein V7111_00680 [Neobacillus niacini]|uniref:hypothetical protein n=1 Tax=Neobacillus niacini TaxID=86668 RepID=UPI002FFDBA30